MKEQMGHDCKKHEKENPGWSTRPFDLLAAERFRRRVVQRNILVIAVARFHHNHAVVRAFLYPSAELDAAIRANTAASKSEMASLKRVYRFHASRELEMLVALNDRCLEQEISKALSRLGGLSGEW